MSSNLPRRHSTATTRWPGQRALWRLLACAGLFALPLLSACATDGGTTDASDSLRCAVPADGAATFPEAKLYFEHNATDGDTGFHGLIDGNGWVELCVFDPSGRQVLAARPLENLGGLGMGTLFWESREPPHDLVSVQDHLQDFPAGDYDIWGTTFDGESLKGQAALTHDIANAPTITAPVHESTVPPTGLVVRWDSVTETIDGRAVELSGYECIVTNEEIDDPFGNSQPILSVHLPPTQTSVTVPDEFLVPGTIYEAEVIAIEASGNQTISVIFFETE